MEKSGKVLVLSGIVLVGFVVAVIFHYYLGICLQKPYPFNTFLMQPAIAFSDFIDLLPWIKGFAPYSPPGNWQQYFPLAYLIMAPFAFIKNKMLAYLLFASFFIGGFTFANIKSFKCENLTKLKNFQNIFILTFLSYPFLFLLQRGNFDMFIFIFFTAFIFSFHSKKYRLAAVFLGIINAMKPFSLLFLVLFLFEKKYRELFLSIALTILLVFGGFMAFKGNIPYQFSILLQSWDLFQKQYIYGLGNWGMTNTSSLFSAVKFLLCGYGSEPIISTHLLAKLYSYFSLFMIAFTTFFAWGEKIFWKRISLLTLIMLLLPHSVYDYKLIFLFVPIYLFVNAKGNQKLYGISDLIYTILFGLLLIPKHYYIIDLMDNMNRLSVSMFINPIIMIAIMALIIYEQFVFGEKDVSEEKN